MGGGGLVEGVEGGGAGHAAGGAGGTAWGKLLHGCFSALHAVHAFAVAFQKGHAVLPLC